MSTTVNKKMIKAINEAIAEHGSMDALSKFLNSRPDASVQLSKSAISRIVTGKTVELRAATAKALEPVFSKYINVQDLTETDVASKIPMDEALLLDTYRGLSQEQRREAHRLLRELIDSKK
ncbi:MAG: hypothetical protein RL095_2148 [Verrucomicrobiota bacterium]|jgi:hypothetical protein